MASVSAGQINSTKGGNGVELKNTALHILGMNRSYRIYSLVINSIMVNYTVTFQMKAPDFLSGVVFTMTVHKCSG